MTSAPTTDIDTDPAQAYQDYYLPAIFEPLTHVVVGHAPPAHGDRVLDLACGTGVVARRVAATVGPGGAVVGVDVNPAMIAVARSQPAPDGATITYHEGDAAALDLSDESIDVAYCQQGLQFLPDRAAGALEMRRVLAGGGRAVVAAWQGLDRHPLYAALAEAEAPLLADLGVPATREDLAAPFSLGGDTLAELLVAAGFADVDVVSRSIVARFATPERFVERVEHAFTAVVPRFAADPAAFAAFVESVEEATRDVVARHRRGDHVVVPMHTAIAVARV